ncbi:MAG: WGR domain-containing protein, partial [Burkholderiaceae bacterium]
MRRFEMVEGSTSKFWEVAVDGATLTTGYGRIGTAGQTKSKTLANEAAALKERDALVREKTGKGYVEVSNVSTPDPRPAAVTSPAPTPMRADESAAAVMAAAPTADIDSTALLRGGFQWAKGELESLPLALRDVHVPEAPDVAALMAAPLQFREEHVSQEARALIPKLIEIYTVDHVSAATDEEWALLLRTARHASFAKQSDRGYGGDWSFGSRWLIETGLAQCGLLHVLRQVMTYAEVVAQTGLGSEDLFRGMLPPLRRSIASAEWPLYVEAMEFLDSLGKQPGLTQLVRAWIAPSVPLWAAALIQSQPPCDLKLPLLACSLPVDKLLAYLEHQLPCEDQEPLADELRAGVLLQMAEQSQETLPLLVWLARRLTQDRKVFIEWMTRLHVPGMPQALAGLIEYPEARAALHALARRFPAAVLHGVATHAFEQNDAVAREWALQLALKQPEAVAPARAVLSDDHRRHLAQLIAASRREEAPLDALPDWLRAPPWVTGARAPALPTLALPAAVRAPALSWPDKDRARWIQRAASPAALPPDQTVETLLAGWYIQPAGIERLKRGEPLQLPGDLAVDPGTGYRQSIWHFPTLPAPVLLAMWNSYPGEMWHEDLYDHVTAIVALHGLDALPGLESYAAAHASSDLPVALHVDSPGLAVTVLQTLRTSKRQKSRAAAWLTRYPETAAAAALPLAFGKDKTARLNGQWGLQWLMAHGFDAQVVAAAAAAGPEATKAVEALRGADPLLDLPARMPELPAFFARAALNAPALRSTGAALPVGIVHHLGMMLAVSTVESPYAGLKAIKALCTPASLAAFAQGLFDAWEAEGAPHKEVWAFQALGLLGDDDIARRLAGRIREWPGQSASQRAMAGLDLLVAIGSDTALMHLNG